MKKHPACWNTVCNKSRVRLFNNGYAQISYSKFWILHKMHFVMIGRLTTKKWLQVFGLIYSLSDSCFKRKDVFFEVKSNLIDLAFRHLHQRSKKIVHLEVWFIISQVIMRSFWFLPNFTLLIFIRLYRYLWYNKSFGSNRNIRELCT